MTDLNERIKTAAEPGVFEVIEWALMVHKDTMSRAQGASIVDQLSNGPYSLDEREEARKILLEYGAGKPTRVVEHRGNSKKPIAFTTTIVPTTPQLKEPAPFAPAELVEENEPANT